MDEVSDLIEPGEVSPTYSRVEGTAGGQAVYFFAVWALFTILIASFALVWKYCLEYLNHSIISTILSFTIIYNTFLLSINTLKFHIYNHLKM